MRKLFLVALVATFCATVVGGALGVSGTDTITTIAGTGTAGYTGEGQATSVRLNSPFGLAAAPDGTVYVADTGNYRVRKISGATISTIAGTGVSGYSGDGGQATSAQLRNLADVAVGSDGSVYVADTANQRIRKVSGGNITTIAGTGTAGYSGDGGQATSAKLAGPQGVDVDPAGNVYIADTNNNRVRKVSLDGTISTVAGDGTATYGGDGGTATSAQLKFPYDVAVAQNGDVYIADYSNNRVRKVAGGKISTVAGTGTASFSGDGGDATAATINAPTGVVVDGAGNLYIADNGNNRVRKVAGGKITTLAGTGAAGSAGDGGQATAAQLKQPSRVSVDAAGNLYITEYGGYRIRKITNGQPTASFTVTPASGTAPLTVNVDGSGSSDPGGAITTFAWDFGDSGTATGATASHQYMGAGSFTVKLTVMDDSGATATATQTVTVAGAAAPPPPSAPGKPKVKCGGKAATIVGTARKNVLTGTPRADVIAGLAGNDTINGLGGNDVICGGPGKDTIKGGPGKDRLIGGAGKDVLVGGPGRDACTGEKRKTC